MALLFKMPIDVKVLKAFPEQQWKIEASPRWLIWCNQLHEYDPPKPVLRVRHLDRKWEMVSAYQKSIRRGLTEFSQELVGGWLSFPFPEVKYFWKRLATTAAEDIGYEDWELVNFVIACHMAYSGIKTPHIHSYQAWQFLTKLMGDSKKSRISCQLSIIENQIRMGKKPPDLTPFEVSCVQKLAQPDASTPLLQWALKNNWRGEGMLKYQHWTLSTVSDLTGIDAPKFLSGLPDYCYDMHTRVGKIVCTRLTGRTPFKDWLKIHMPEAGEEKREAIGYAMFFREGGLLHQGTWCGPISVMEQKYVAARFNVDYDAWYELRMHMTAALESGLVNELRAKTLEPMYQ